MSNVDLSSSVAAIPQPEPSLTPARVGEEAAPNRKGRRAAAKGKKGKDAGKTLPSFADLGIDNPEATAELVQCEAELKEGDRRDVGSTFLRGAAIARARPLCGPQKVFEAWTVKRCNLSRKGAENYERVHLHLSAYRERLVAIGMLRSSMYELAHGTKDKVEAVLEAFEAGTEMTAAQIKAFVKAGEEAEPDAEPADTGGPEGIKAMARLKLSVGLPTLMKRIQAILAAMLEELDAHARGKRVAKGELIAKVEHSARGAGAELASLSRFVSHGVHHGEWKVQAEPFPEGSGWAEVNALLLKLGKREKWPDAGELGSWLMETAVPLLEWALGPKLADQVRKADEARLAAEAAKVAPTRKRGGAKVEGEAVSPRKSAGASAKPGKSKPKADSSARGRKKVAAAATEAPLVPDLAEEPSAPSPAKL